jgi:hypothetical protein
LDPKENTAVNELAFPGVIENTFLSELVVINSLFEKNDFSDTNNPAVRSLATATSRTLLYLFEI